MIKYIKNIINNNNNEYLIILIYFGLLFILDYLRIMDLYGQNFYRRAINMYRRTDSLAYHNRLQPFCEPVKKILNSEDIKKLQSIKIPKNKDMSWFSRKNTTTHQCCKNFNENEKKIISEISEKVKKMYEEQIGKPLYYMGKNEPTIYVYHGKNSHHLWHVDPLNLNKIYNIIICFKKKGEISPLQCKNNIGEISSIYFEEGDAAIFNGGTTIHQVPKNDDENSERTVLSIAFTDDNKLNDNKNISNNLCTYIEGGNNYFNLFKLMLTIFVINFIISYISNTNNLSYNFLFIFLTLVLIIIKYIPLYVNTGLGSGRSSSIINNLIFLTIFSILPTFSIKGGILFFSYFALSDVFFIRSYVGYD